MLCQTNFFGNSWLHECKRFVKPPYCDSAYWLKYFIWFYSHHKKRLSTWDPSNYFQNYESFKASIPIFFIDKSYSIKAWDKHRVKFLGTWWDWILRMLFFLSILSFLCSNYRKWLPYQIYRQKFVCSTTKSIHNSSQNRFHKFGFWTFFPEAFLICHTA